MQATGIWIAICAARPNKGAIFNHNSVHPNLPNIQVQAAPLDRQKVGRSGKSPFRNAHWDSGRSGPLIGMSAARALIDTHASLDCYCDRARSVLGTAQMKWEFESLPARHTAICRRLPPTATLKPKRLRDVAARRILTAVRSFVQPFVGERYCARLLSARTAPTIFFLTPQRLRRVSLPHRPACPAHR